MWKYQQQGTAGGNEIETRQVYEVSRGIPSFSGFAIESGATLFIPEEKGDVDNATC